MKAKGTSGSRRFSARLKCTRPTRFQAGLSAFRKLWRSVPAATRDADAAWAVSIQRARSTSDVRYSAPVIIGAVKTRVARSASPGAGTSGTTEVGPSSPAPAACRHSAATYRAAKARHQARTGGSAWPISPAPSRSSPCPVPWAKALPRRSALESSRSEASAAASTIRCPCGRLVAWIGPGA